MPTKALILAGGEATRLHPLTLDIPKIMLPLANLSLSERMVRYLTAQGISEVIFSLARKNFKENFPFRVNLQAESSKELGAEIDCLIEEKPLGTGGAIKKAEPLLKDTFLVLNGDIFTNLDLTQLLNFHRTHAAELTIALKEVEDPTPFGVVETDPEGRIQRFLEKPQPHQTESRSINAGIYVLQPEILQQFPSERAFRTSPSTPNRAEGHLPSGGERACLRGQTPCSLERDIFPLLLEQGRRVFGFLSDPYWIDIGTPESYLQAHRDILSGIIEVEIPAERHGEGLWLGEGVSIHGTAELEPPALISGGCFVEKNARVGKFSVLGPNVTLEEETSVEDSILLANVNVNVGAKIQGAILGADCTVREGTVIKGGLFRSKTTIGS